MVTVDTKRATDGRSPGGGFRLTTTTTLQQAIASVVYGGVVFPADCAGVVGVAVVVIVLLSGADYRCKLWETMVACQGYRIPCGLIK